MKSISNCIEKHDFVKKERSQFLAYTTSLFYSTCIAIITIFCSYLIFYQTNIKYTINIHNYFNQTNKFTPLTNQDTNKLTLLWSPFLNTASARQVNGTSTKGFHIHLDRVDTRWSEELPSIDYAVISAAHWFFRPNYLYENKKLIGCVYCTDPNVAVFGPGQAIGRVFRTAFKAINECKNCKKIVTFLRTYSPAHFKGGSWDGGGACNGTRPIGREEADETAAGWEYRRVQLEEVAAARKGGEGRNEFEILDVTEMMTVRVDGHPGIYWGNHRMRGLSDCLHWCMPGPIDTWSELMLERIKRRNGESLGVS